jgi:crotonobetainyl-CoA:carnitine CoA-transferase CaiB-like acyl-CoA transferase
MAGTDRVKQAMNTLPGRPRVADFSTHLSGPVASRQLSQLGADVVKIENPRVGDGNRDFPPYFHDEGVHHLALNTGTRSVAFDAKSPQWPLLVERIAKWADAVIVGNRPANARRLGIDFPTLLGHNRNLIYCLITGYGVAGEWAEFPAHGLNMDAWAGAVPLEATASHPEVPAHFRTVGTTLAGIQAALGIYAALYRQTQGGGGQVVHVSAWEAALTWMWRDLATYANLGRPWTPYRDLGSRYAVYGTSDGGTLLVCPIEKSFWERFCDALDMPAALKARGDWTSGSDMGEAYVSLGEREEIQQRIGKRTMQEWRDRLALAEVPFAPLLDWREAMASQHASANGVLAHYTYRGHDVTVPTTPVSVTPAASLGDTGYEALARAHSAKADAVRRPPTLGEHTEELLREWDFPAPTKAN